MIMCYWFVVFCCFGLVLLFVVLCVSVIFCLFGW